MKWYWWVLIAVALLAVGYAILTSVQSRKTLKDIESNILSSNPNDAQTGATPVYKSLGVYTERNAYGGGRGYRSNNIFQ
jgi:hypothetical protein